MSGSVVFVEEGLGDEQGRAVKCAIMQPTYFPWAGFFNLISKVDYFVFLDDAQFQKTSWHNRNKLIANGAPTWVTVPVRRVSLQQKLCDSMLDDTKSWRRKHVQLISQNYRNHPFSEQIFFLLEVIQDSGINILSTLNIRLIKSTCALLGLDTPFVLSSTLGIDGKRSERLIKICQHLGCTEYISPEGATDYLEMDGFAQLSDIKLTINKYDPKEYPQKQSKSFVSHLSILDVIANLGNEKTVEYITSRHTEGVS